jgi:hypothetical protein
VGWGAPPIEIGACWPLAGRPPPRTGDVVRPRPRRWATGAGRLCPGHQARIHSPAVRVVGDRRGPPLPGPPGANSFAGRAGVGWGAPPIEIGACWPLAGRPPPRTGDVVRPRPRRWATGAGRPCPGHQARIHSPAVRVVGDRRGPPLPGPPGANSFAGRAWYRTRRRFIRRPCGRIGGRLRLEIGACWPLAGRPPPRTRNGVRPRSRRWATGAGRPCPGHQARIHSPAVRVVSNTGANSFAGRARGIEYGREFIRRPRSTILTYTLLTAPTNNCYALHIDQMF